MQPTRFSIRLVALVTVLAAAMPFLAPAGAHAQSCNPCQMLDVRCTISGGCQFLCVPDLDMVGQKCREGSGDMCNPAEYCDARGVCPADVRAAAGTVCHESTGMCDPAEVCDGSGRACPTDKLTAAGTVCRDSLGVCDVAESCTGTSRECPADRLRSAGATCRASTAACDAAETCDGTSPACPTDGVKAAGIVCRAPAGVCDVAETCDGIMKGCRVNTFAAAGTECRAAAGACDVAEACSGSSATCPSDGKLAAGTICRDASGACDVAESCDGSSRDCAADVLVAAGTVCRDGAGECDPSEVCTGASGECPSDVVVAAGTPCTEDPDLCTIDACDGAGACAHTPAADADADGTCDGQDPCTNVGGERTFADASKPTLALTRVNLDPTPGDDGLKLKASFDLPADKRFADLALDANGAHLIVDAVGGARVVDALLPPGSSAGKGTRGWTRAKSGKSWTYLDKTGAPIAGIVKVQVTDKRKVDAPGRVQVTIVGKNGDYPVLADDVPLAAIVTLGGPTDAAAGLCAESGYASDDCILDRKGTSLSCKR